MTRAGNKRNPTLNNKFGNIKFLLSCFIHLVLVRLTTIFYQFDTLLSMSNASMLQPPEVSTNSSI
jgi:hypothetical protein